MKVLFVISGVYFQEPLGVLILSAVCKKKGHETRLAILNIHSFDDMLRTFDPDLIAYSTMSPDEAVFIEADQTAKTFVSESKKKIVRIMGGPHPTFFETILAKMDLDAICVGEGDLAIGRIVDRMEAGKDLTGIPNVRCKGAPDFEKEIVPDLDALPFPDRQLLYEARPDSQSIALRSFLTSRGCPYSCTYCFNHSYNKLFAGKGKLLRRRSVDNILQEIKQVKQQYPPMRFIRFADDTFVYKKDAWLEEFSARFKKEINIPFYCLMRSNTLTEDVAILLSKAGCVSVGMAIESGNAEVRNQILKRNLSDETVKHSFQIARKYHFSTYGGTILGIPGTTLQHDYENIAFAKKVKLTVPVFSIFAPYPKTDLAEYAKEHGYLDPSHNEFPHLSEKSVLTCFTDEEKDIQQRLTYLGYLYCVIPFFPFSLLKALSRMDFLKTYSLIYSVLASYMMQSKLVPGSSPRNPKQLFKSFWIFLKYWRQGTTKKTMGKPQKPGIVRVNS